MWSLLFYYALLNAVCVGILLVIAHDPPVWEEEEDMAWPPVLAEPPALPDCGVTRREAAASPPLPAPPVQVAA